MRFEEQYPAEARKKEIAQVMGEIAKGQSCQLIGMPGAGRSTILRLIAYHKKLRELHLTHHEAHYCFVLVNFAEISSFETEELHKFLFLSLVNAIENSEVKKEIDSLFTTALEVKDPTVLFQNLKKSIELLNDKSLIPILLFDRFSEFATKVPDSFFKDLKNLRRATHGRLAIVFSTHYPLEKLLPEEEKSDFWEFLAGQHIFLELNDPITTNFRISLLEKETGKLLDERIKERLIELTGGHAKLMKLSAQLVLAEAETLQNKDLKPFLLSHVLIQGSLLEIWQSLPKEDQELLKSQTQSSKHETNHNFQNKNSETISDFLAKLDIPFPLLSDFIEEVKKDEPIKKEIRQEDDSNEIFFGNDPVSGLTSYEFKLLSFLIANPNRVATRDEIIQHVWSDEKTQEGVSDEALSQMIHRLRRKIEDEAESPKHILTVKGRGIRFIP